MNVQPGDRASRVRARVGPVRDHERLADNHRASLPTGALVRESRRAGQPESVASLVVALSLVTRWVTGRTVLLLECSQYPEYSEHSENTSTVRPTCSLSAAGRPGSRVAEG